MEQAIHKAAALVEAYQYIRQFADKVIVIKIGGSIMDDPDALKSLLNDICFMHVVGMRPVLVHGGGKAINEAMKAAGLDAQFVQGRRYTDERTLAIAEHVLVNQINADLVSTINSLGRKAMGLHSLASCVIFGKRIYLKGEQGRKIDIGYVGELNDVNAQLILALVSADCIPVIAPIARDAAGSKLNINADSAAGQIAAFLKAEKLILVSDTHGIRTSDSEDSLASHLNRNEIQQLIDTSVISSGMLPKVEAALTALQAGVSKTHIIDGRIPHSLLLEIFSSEGIGTEIVLH